MASLHAFSAFLFDLQARADQAADADLHLAVLQRLSQLLVFDSAVWASGVLTADGPDFHTVQLWRQPAQLLVDYEAIKHLDPLFQRSAAAPGRSVSGIARQTLPPVFMPLVQRYGLEQAMSTMVVDPRSGLLNGISLWRAAVDRPFDGDDEAAMEAAFPHLVAHAQGRLLGPVPALDRVCAARACADRRGCLHAAGERWLDLMQQEFPGWCGPLLPAAVHPALSVDERPMLLQLQHTVLRALARPPFVALDLRPRVAWDRLSPREQTVARLAAGGATHKDVAAALQLSPATVRNHLARIYAELRIHRRSDLAACLQAAQFPSQG